MRLRSLRLLVECNRAAVGERWSLWRTPRVTLCGVFGRDSQGCLPRSVRSRAPWRSIYQDVQVGTRFLADQFGETSTVLVSALLESLSRTVSHRRMSRDLSHPWPVDVRHELHIRNLHASLPRFHAVVVQAFGTRCHPDAVASTVATSAVQLVRNSFPSRDIHVHTRLDDLTIYTDQILPPSAFILRSLIVAIVSFRRAMVAAHLAPCFSAFSATRAFPTAVFGPVLFIQGRVRWMLARSDRRPFVDSA